MNFDKKRITNILLRLVLLGSAFVAGMLFYANVYVTMPSVPSLVVLVNSPQNPPPGTAELTIFWEAWAFLNQEFYSKIPPNNQRIDGAIRGMVATFGDQHTLFIDSAQAAINNESLGGGFDGIGASIRKNESGQLIIAEPFPDQPAMRAGLRFGDIILKIDGQSAEDLNLAESVARIRGKANSTVVLTILRQGRADPFDVSVLRAKIELELVQMKMLDHHVGYIRLTQFSEGVSDKVSMAIQDLSKRGATSLVLDLRNNPGGLLSEAINVSSLFISGPIVIERLKGGEEKTFTSQESHQKATDMPLAVLVNGGSASASEIVTGAVQDTHRGTIIGEQTFGKGSVQLPHRLSDGSELRVTIAEWLTPARRQINKIGIKVDIGVKITPEDFERKRDPQLERAVEIIGRKND